MPVDRDLLRDARTAAAEWVEAQERTELAKADYHHAVRRLHLAGASLREIADALDISHQRVHQMIDEAGGTEGWKPRLKVGDCSFCGATAEDAERLIAGPGVFVCDGCVRRFRAQPPLTSGSAQCSFCDRPAGADGWLAERAGVRICDRCLEFCAEVLATRV
jgi:hypothetical protein